MTYTDGSSPQLTFIDRVFVAYSTCNMDNVAPFLSEHFKFSSHPEIDDLPGHKKDTHIDLYGPMFAKLVKMDYIFHEVIDAPGKVVIQWTALCTPPDGDTFEYDSLSIFTIGEEHGKLKVLEFKDFSDHQKRHHFHKTLS